MSRFPARSRGARARAPLPVVLLLPLLAMACAKKEVAPPPPPEVVIACAESRDIPVAMEFVGQTKGSTDVEIRARVEGFLESMNFKEGSRVKAGDLLYTIDPKPFEATLAQARAAEAQARAVLGRTKQDEDRLKPLAEQRAVPQRDYDVSISNRQAAEAALQAASAQVEQAKIDLGYTRITSPIHGLVGMTEVQIGNLVGRGQSTLLTTVSTVDPIAVRFSISEAEYLRLARELAARAAQAEAQGEEREKAQITITLADGTAYPERGQINTADRLVDPATGTLMLEALFANSEGLIRPGQFARVQVVTGVQKGAVVIPQRAVQEMQGRYTVALVGPENKVVLRPVDPGEKAGSDWVMRSGLAAGECFVVEGLQRIRDGMTVSPRTAGEAAPAPEGAGEAAPAEGGEKSEGHGEGHGD